MGMAASQARYLELTARKTNVEYQGQQINQQRTELANVSAGLFSQLMGLQVPTAPSTSNYTKTIYTFSDGQNNCTLGSVSYISDDPSYNATVTYTYPNTEYRGIESIKTEYGARQVTQSGVTNWWLTDGVKDGNNKTKLTQCTTTSDDTASIQQELTQICLNNPSSKLASDLGWNGSAIDTTKIGNAYYYKVGSTYNYVGASDLDAMPDDGVKGSLPTYYASNITKTVTTSSKAYIDKNSSGRYTDITLASSPNTTFDVNSTTTTDQNAYNDAFNQYEYQQTLYQQEVTAINAKTSSIEQQDRTLELQLKQLDTEQEALSTEMEAVKKVIDKNIDQTFKTFSS